ncbi:fatty acid-binding protein 2-like [Colias croceus]|uniref:fatty acid-binding protein 2-like n=1 Tax=Colias crocea TaxID=72248 RepID=UPI001E27F3AB|nr:fatty acid-binding protein 2-like [Colias croceus]
MSFFGKVYKLDRSENFDAFAESLKLSPLETQALINIKSSQKLDKDGDEYILTTFYEGQSSEIKFKSGVEFDEILRADVTPKSVITVDGNKLTHVQKFQDGNSITCIREFSPEKLVVTITSNFWSGTAKRYFVAE